MVVVVNPRSPEAELIAKAAEKLREGGLVAFPTETVYGLGANALHPQAVLRIFAVKGRPSDHPLIVHVGRVEDAVPLVSVWPPVADALVAAFWPGPLTLVLPKSALVPDEVTGGLDSVAVRMPAHPVALALLEAARIPVAAPSANPHTRVSPTTAQHVVEGLGDRVDIIIDGGPCAVGIESTVLSLLEDPPRVLRQGMIGVSELEQVVPGVAVGPSQRAEPRRSPGMAPVHYAPRAPLSMVRTFPAPKGQLEGRIVFGSSPGEQREGQVVTITLPNDPPGSAAGLYSALHRLDALGCERIFVVDPPSGPEWAAINDRLARAGSAR